MFRRFWLNKYGRANRFVRGAYGRIHNWIVPPYPTLFVEDTLPKQLKRRTLYIVEEDGFQEQAAMICPCGCRSVLHMNLLPDERPCWRVTRHDDGTATLHPSVWRKKECGSHFWFRNGRVVWC
ncbi:MULTISPECIES: DUF6527 family protein [unclassified Bradyrhizobium]